MADNQQYGPLAPKQTSANDIRKVIANGPKAIGQGSTIATSDELKKKEVDKANSNPKVPTTTKKQSTTTKTNTNVVAPKQTNTVVKKPETQGVNKFASLMQGQISGDLFKNPAVQPINDIKVVKQDNEATHNAAPNNNNDISFMNNFGRAKELKDTVDIDNALMDLYSDIKVKVDNGTLASSDVAKMKQAYPEFANMGDDVLLSMIGDMASIANKKMPFNDVNMKKLKSLYPELNSAAWGFDKGNSENMYQAGGMREQMAQSSKTDLNRFGTAGAVAESAINPIGEATTLLDMGAQMIPQVDSNNDRSSALQKELQKIVSNEDLLNQYKEQYKNFVKENGTLSSLYTTQLEGDNTVERLWNWVTGKGKKDVDAGFRDWLINTVNTNINGWAGHIMGDANDISGISGPNVAKMYANMPASAVKTVTAITRAITNPIDTAAGLYHLFGTEEGRQALISRYGSWDGFAKALEQDPVGVASDGLAVVEGGAGLTKMAAGGLSKASLLAGLSTEALGAARTTENLLKLATRLENMVIKAGKIEKTAGLASNLGADLPINKVINGLRKWGESGESMIQKVAKYSANASQTGIGTVAGKAIDEGKKIIKEGPINTIANKLMGSASDTDKLFKAASPNLNKLTNNVNYKNKRQNMDIATQAIVDAGYTPKSLSEWAKAHTETLNKKWNEFKKMIKDKSDFEVDVKDLLTEVKDYIKREREGATEAQKADLRKLEVEVNNIERRGKVDMGFIENRKEHYNSSWRDADKLKVGDIYLKGIKLIGNAMRKQQDNILGKGPEQTKKLRKEIAALMDTKEDVIKADVRNQKKKSDIAGGGLIESYGRLSGLGDFIGGTLSTLTKGGEGLAQAGKGIGKMILGNAMGRARDVDYLTKKGFEGLSNKKKAQNNVGGLKNKFQESKELGELYVERDNLRKELKKDNISNSKKEAINKRLDDVEYAIAQKKARAGLGDKERTLNAENKKKVVDMVSKRAKDVGFTTEVLDGMEKDTQGYTDLRNKLIALEKNPGDTTAQHELFHAFFSVVDNKTKTYILDEAKKILRESGMKDVNAEEWLAESFGIYAKRKQIKLGLIDAPKGFVAKVRDFFQRVYEFMQRFNGDRATINKVFDEVLGDRQMKNGIIDLSDLLGDKEVKVRELGDNGLRNKAVYHGSPADFDKFDSSHMGEGEGAQAHGRGHYVAVNRKTAEGYAEMGRSEYNYKGKDGAELSKSDSPEDLAASYILKEIGFKDNIDIKKSINDAKEYFKEMKENAEGALKRHPGSEMIERNVKHFDKLLQGAENLKEGDFDKPKSRNLYTNDIPDPVKADTPTGKNYLEEKELMSADATKKFIEVFGKEHPTKVEQLKANIDSNGYARGGRVEGWEMYTYLEDLLGSPKAASKFLESIGYDGIHYIGKRDGEAYVIFNDDAVQIKDHLRYKKKTDSEGRELSDRQLKYFGNSKVRNDKGELVPVYHFTADNFNTVDFKKGAQNYFWFTSDKNASDRAMGVRPGMEKKRKDMYVDIKNPAGWDEYNKFGTDELKARGYDGVILKEKDGSFEGFIWDKENQVKYVDNQNPTRASKDMRFKKDLSLKEKDAEYEKAVESGDKEKALGMIRKAAAEKGYDSSSDYQGSKAFNGSAPSSEGYTKAERINPDTEMYSQTLGDYASDGVDIGDLDWQLTDRGNYIRGDEYIRESIDNLNKAVREYKAGNKNAKIKMYRAIDADIKENGFRNGDWITPSKKYAKMHIGLQDWKKGRIIEEEVPIENIWWDNNDINEWGYDDGKEYGYKNTPNNKKELGITYDDKGKLIPLEKRFDEKNPDVRFKKKSEVPEDKKLIGLHNLGIDKLRGVIELGGMPMPSIAVTKKGVPHESYGDITFIMKESAINPALSRKNKLYTVDGYTPTVPQPTIKVKDTKEANLLMDKIQKETGIGYGELMQWLEYHDDRYFKDYPKLKEFDKYYDQLTEKKLFDGFTYSGKRRYKDYNLDNIVKSMVGNKRDAFNGAFWKMVAQSQGNATVDKLRERKYGLKDKDLAEKIGEKYYDALRELASKKGIEQKIESLSDYGRFAENVSDAYRANTDAWWRELTQWDGAEGTIYSKITKEDLEPLQKIIKEAAELPRPYSEAKPERAIRFDEVGAVVAPEGKLKEVKDMLKDTGLKVYGYKEGERMSVVDKVADDNGLRFKRKNTDDIVGHASPYSFDKYDASKRATGYGGQVYGAGIYTSEDLGMVAGKYGKKDADKFNSETMYKGLPLREQYDEKYVAQIMHDSMMKGLTFKEAKQEIVDAWKDTKDPNKKAMLKELGLMKKSDFDGKGNLYTYKIDKDGKWLDWQQKTSQEDVNLISKELAKINKEGAKKFDSYMKSSEYATLGQNIYQELSRTLGGDQKASDFLKSIGFEGNKYKAESNKYNYVIFDYDKPINEHIRFKKQTDTPEFKKWFEGSKVVDKSGKPLVAYHGTHGDFTVFDREKIGSNTNNKGIFGEGFYFTNRKSYGDYYAQPGFSKDFNSLEGKTAEDIEKMRGKTMETYLNIKNPFRWNDINTKAKMNSLIKELGLKPSDLRWNNTYKDQIAPIIEPNKSIKFREALQKAGYDGVIYEFKGDINGEKQLEIVAFEPNQIKSATDNIGTFDKNNPDIRYKKGLQKKGNGLHKKSNASILAKGRDRK